MEITPEIIKAQFDEIQRHDARARLTAAYATIDALAKALESMLLNVDCYYGDSEGFEEERAALNHARVIQLARGG